jgi:short-subunit dehydrogenase
MSDSSSKPVAVVTGASSGIGAVYADRLAARGYDLILVARRADRLEALSAKLTNAYGAGVETIPADLTDEAGLAAVEKVLATDARVSLLVNNAGMATLKPFTQTTPQEAATQVALNITALTRLTQAVLPAFLARNSGAIINVASVLSIYTLPVSSVYSGTKGYVLNFSRGLQQELAETGVKVQLVLPAATATEIWDLGGVPLASLDQTTVMSAGNLVDAALAGFDKGEALTWPSVADESLVENYEAARIALFAASQNGQPAARYTGG